MSSASWMLTCLAALACTPLPQPEAAPRAARPIAETPVARAPVEPTPIAPPPVLLLLSIDGLMPSQVLRADVLGLKVPNLRRLAVDGAFATGVRGVVPGVTYPAHTTVLTGTSPAHHGILMNTPFDPMGQNKRGWSWYAKDIRDPTLWSVATSADLVTANLCWPVSVSAPVTYNVVQYWRGSPGEDRKLYDALSTPGLLDELEAAVGPLPYGLDFSVEADETRARFAEELIRTKRPSFATAYLGSLDETEHKSGTSAEPALAVLERLDAVVGRLRGALEAVAGARFVLAVVSDHGFADYTKEIELGALLAEKGLMKLGPGPKVTDFGAAPWVAGGTGAIMLRDQNDLAAKQSLARLIEELKANPKYGVSRIFRGAEIRCAGRFLRGGHRHRAQGRLQVRHPAQGAGRHAQAGRDPRVPAGRARHGRGLFRGRARRSRRSLARPHRHARHRADAGFDPRHLSARSGGQGPLAAAVALVEEVA